MVKREMVVPGTQLQVSKVPPGPAGPSFAGKFAQHERLTVTSRPFTSGGLNLVKVKREKTGDDIEVMYAFVTNYCRLSTTSKRPSRAKRKTPLDTQSPTETPTLVPTGDTVPPSSNHETNH
jgi:hypothetical protein